MMRWPWSKDPVDVQALAREVAQETAQRTAVEVAEQIARANFPTPLSPVGPQHPIYAFNHPWQYYTPQSPERKPGAYITTNQMRELARSYDVLRSCINHLKREVAAVPGRIGARDPKDKSEATKRAIAEAEIFFSIDGGLGGVGRRPRHFESETLEDLLVIGASAVFFEPLRDGMLLQVYPVDAATIRPRVDAYGFEGPGEIAYEQWIEGVQTGPGYTVQQLHYDGLHPVSYSPYYVGPVEWLINVINGALRADGWNLAWLTDGSTPADILAAPESWTPDQIKNFAAYFDGMLAGNSRQRQKTRFVPGGTQRVGSPSRKDQDFQEFELWLMRRTCGIMGVAPAAVSFAGEQYKVSQEGSMKAGTQFGAGQILEFRKDLYNLILQRLGYPFLQWVDVTDEEDDAKTKAETGEILIRSSQRTPNELRQLDGEDPLEGGDTLFVLNTLVPVEQAIKPPEPPPAANGAVSAQDDEGEASGGADDSQDSAQRAADLRKWREKALKRVKDGKPAACAFESGAIDASTSSRIGEWLKRCVNAEDVRAVFRAWSEEDHPRDEKGRFTGSGTSGVSEPSSDREADVPDDSLGEETDVEQSKRLHTEMGSVVQAISQITGVSSNWKEKIIVNPELNSRAVKKFSCVVEVRPDTARSKDRWRTLVCEGFHAASAGFERSAFTANPGWEEGVNEHLQRLFIGPVTEKIGVQYDREKARADDEGHPFEQYGSALEELRTALGDQPRDFYLGLLKTPIAQRSIAMLQRGNKLQGAERERFRNVYPRVNAALKREIKPHEKLGKPNAS